MILLIGNWLLFKKMGYKGWTSLIPFYSNYCYFYALYGNGWLFLAPIGIALLAVIFLVITLLIAYSSRSYGMIMPMVIIAALGAAIGELLFRINVIKNTTHSFGKSGWWTFGTFVFAPIFKLIYAYDSEIKFRKNPYPDYRNYDAVDGFFEFFRKQKDSKNDHLTIKRCRKCGAPLRENTEFCSECGERII